MAPTKRIRVGVLAGGASAERQISLASGLQIAEQLQIGLAVFGRRTCERERGANCQCR